MADSERVTWRRVRAGEYESEAGWVVRVEGGGPECWPWGFRAVGDPIVKLRRCRTLADAKAACERAWREGLSARTCIGCAKALQPFEAWQTSNHERPLCESCFRARTA